MRSVSIICLIILISFGTVTMAADYQEIMGQRQISFFEIGEGQWKEVNPQIRAYYARQESTVQVFYQFQNWLKSLEFGEVNLGQLIDSNPDIASVISLQLFKDFRLEEQIYPNGMVKMTLIRTWNGTELALYLDRLYRERTYENSGSNLTQSGGREGSDGHTGVLDKDYTGVIIDTRGYGIKPSMAPKIYDANEVEVYGTMNTDLKYIIEVGIVGYAYDLEEAIKDGRVGNNPLIVNAIGRMGAAKDMAIISIKDGDIIRDMANHTTLLNECKVMFIID